MKTLVILTVASLVFFTHNIYASLKKIGSIDVTVNHTLHRFV